MSEIYRDRSDGAAARRQDLLRKRRDELVTMPHAVRRVVVARRARIAGSLAVIAAAMPLVAAIYKPSLAALVAKALPGIAPAPLSTLLFAGWLFGLAAYLASRARAEHRFAVAMSRYVLPGKDVDHDVERLSNEHPDADARAMAHRLEVSSAALPVLAVALLVPATALFAARVLQLFTWPSISDFEIDLAHHATPIALAAGVGVIATLAMTRRALRLPVVAGLAICFALGLGGVGLAVHSWALTLSSPIALAIGVVGWRLARERKRIEAIDPAAGSEMLTLRGMLRAIRAGLGKLRALITRDRVRAFVRGRPIVTALGIVLVAGSFGYVWMHHHAAPRTTVAPPVIAKAPRVLAAPLAKGNSTFTVHRTSDGAISVDVDLSTREPVAIDDLADLPPGWHATVKVRALDAVHHGDFRVNAFPGDPASEATLLHAVDFEEVQTTDTCDHEASLGLRVEPLYQPQPGEHVTFMLEPTLTLAACK